MAGQPARFHGAANGAYHALDTRFASQPRRAHSAARGGSWASAGVTSTSCAAKNCSARRCQDVRPDGRGKPARSANRPTAACRRVRGWSCSRCATVRASSSVPATQRTIPDVPIFCPYGGVAWRTVWPASRNSAPTSRAAPAQCSATRTPLIGERVDTATRTRPGSPTDCERGVAGEHRQHQRAVINGRRDRAVLRHVEPGSVAQVRRDEPETGLETDKATARGRDPDRAHPVVAVRHGHHAGGHRGRGTA